MLSLSATILAAQLKGRKPLGKVVFVKGSTRYAYTTNDILFDAAITEEGIDQKADIFLLNNDGALTSIDFRGYTATLHRGFRTGVARSIWVKNTVYAVDDVRTPTTANLNGYQYRCSVAGTSHAATEPTWPTTLGAVVTDGTVTWEMDGNTGDEYSRMAPLLVIAPDMLSSLRALRVVYSAVGKGNQMAMDRATADYFPAATNTDTIKTIITAVMGATLACFNHCTAYTVANGLLVWDSEDDVIDSYAPADSFRVYYRATRKDTIVGLLSDTRCVGRWEKDGALHIRKLVNGQALAWAAATAYLVNDTVKPTTDNGHIYKCTTAGTSHAVTEPTWGTTIDGTTSDGATLVWTLFYDYQYNDATNSANHIFISDSHRKRIVLPDRITVESHPDHSLPHYTGTATDTDSYALLAALEPIRKRLSSDAMALKIAKAILTNLQRAAERGSANIPMNVGQQMYDLVKLTDSRSGASQIGNVGYIFSHIAPTQFNMSLRLGSPSMGVPMGLSAPASLKTTERAPTWENLAELYENQKRLQDRLLNLQSIVDDLITNVSPDGLTDSTFGNRAIGVIAVDAATDLSVADGVAYIPIPAILHNMYLFRAQAMVITAGTTGATTVSIYNVTDSVEMLSGNISIASGDTVGTVGTIDTAHDDVTLNDVLRVNVKTISTTPPKGLLIVLEFAYP